MKRKLLIALMGLLTVVSALTLTAQAQTGWFDPAWEYQTQIAIANPAGSSLSNFQVQVALNGSFNFAQAKSDGSDVRVTASDGVTSIPFWIESWNASNASAVIWVQVPSIPSTGTTVYLYYGNPAASSASNGNATFNFFDDFQSWIPTPGYFQLSSLQTVIEQSQAWENVPPHTLSVVQANSGGYTYWGYYGLVNSTSSTCGGIGLAYSNDLVTWTKYTGNPVFTNGRWASVRLVNGTFYMTYTQNYCDSNDQIELATSTDGINWTDVETLVPAGYGGYSGNIRNQNSDLFLNPNDGKFYLYWYSGNDADTYHIMVRSASSPSGLSDGSSDITIASSTNTLAAPNAFYYNGTYYLSTETLNNGTCSDSSKCQWNVNVFSSASPTGGFTPLPGNPVVGNDTACMFQHQFGTTLHSYFCKRQDPTNIDSWVIQHASADLTAPRITYGTPDPTKWTASGGSWISVSDTQQDGSTGMVAQGTTTAVQILSSTSYTGGDYVVQAYGKQMSGDVWGLGARVRNSGTFYSTNLYDSYYPDDNLFLYGWLGSTQSASQLGSANVGQVNPNQWYQLMTKIHGSEIDVYKDGVLQIQGSDSSITSGGVALYGEAGSAAEFNDLLVRQYASTEPVATLGTTTAEGPFSLTLNPGSVIGGNSSTGTVTLNSAAPSGGAVVTLTSSNSSLAAVPATVTVPAGSTTANFTISTTSVATTEQATITATYKGAIQSAVLTVTPFLTSLTLNPVIVIGGNSSTGTVQLGAAAPSGGIQVFLSTSNSSVATVPSSVTVLQGATSASFAVTTTAVSSPVGVTISASYNSGTQTATLTVNPPTVTLVALTPASVVGGSSSTGTVTLSAAAPAGGAVVTLVSNSVAAQVGPSVTVAAGAATATFPVTTSTVAATVVATISATYNNSTQSAPLTVYPVTGPPTVAFVRDAGNSGESVLYTVSISSTAGDFLVVFVWQAEGATTPSVTDNLGSTYTQDCDLSYNQGSGVRELTVYHLLNAPSGITGVNITPNKPSRGIVAEYSGMPTSGSLLDVCGTVNNQTSPVTSWSSTATTTTFTDLVFGLADTGFTAHAGYSASGGWTGRLEQSDTTDADDSYFEEQIGMAAGSYTATGTTTSSVGESSVVVAFKTSTALVASVTLNPASVVGGSSSTGTVTLSGAAPAGGAVVALVSNNLAAQVGASVTVAAGSTTATFPVTTSPVATTTVVTISATYNSSTQSATLTVNSTPYAAVMQTPTPGSTLTGSSVTFTWSAGSGATAYWIDIGSVAGGNKHYSSGSLSTTTFSATVNTLPTDGSTVYVTLYSLINGSWVSNPYTYTAFNAAAASGAITSPANHSTLSGSSVTFNWTAGTGASAYWLDVGSTAGGNNYYSSGNLGSVLTVTVNGLPTNGSAVYATLYSLIGGVWAPNAYTYTAFNAAAAGGVLTTPAPGSTLSGSSVTFDWTAGAGASAYWMDIGSTAGGNNYYSSGNLGSALSVTVSGLPTNGSTVYVTLYSYVGEQWSGNTYNYTAFNGSGLGVLYSPPPGVTTVLSTNSVTFSWYAGTFASAYWLDIGTSPGRNDIYSSYLGNVLTTTVPNVWPYGNTLYVTLYSLVNGQWYSNAYEYTEAPGAVMQTPTPGSMLASGSQTFTWIGTCNCTTSYQINVGSTYGGFDIYESGNLGNVTNFTVTLPAEYSTIYVTLEALYQGHWLYSFYAYSVE